MLFLSFVFGNIICLTLLPRVRLPFHLSARKRTRLALFKRREVLTAGGLFRLAHRLKTGQSANAAKGKPPGIKRVIIFSNTIKDMVLFHFAFSFLWLLVHLCICF